MKRILIVSDFFFPSTVIGAVRPSKIAKKLTEDGYILFSDEEIEAIDNEFMPDETEKIEDLI